MISGYHEVELLELLRGQIEPVAALYDIGLHAHLHIEFRVFHVHPLYVIAHVHDLVPVDPVEQMSRTVIRYRNKIEVLVEGFSHIVLHRAFAV